MGKSQPSHLHCLAGGNGVGRLVNEVSSVQANDVDAKDLPRVATVDQLEGWRVVR